MPEMSTLNKLTSMYLLDFEFVDGIAFVDNSCKQGDFNLDKLLLLIDCNSFVRHFIFLERKPELYSYVTCTTTHEFQTCYQQT